MNLHIYKSLLAACIGLTYPDEVLLDKVEQLTFPSMGFEKAGEAYFSPDSNAIVFQAVPSGKTGYQIYKMDLTTKKIIQISHEAKACTCSFFHPKEKLLIYAASPEKSVEPEAGNYKWDLTSYMNIYRADLEGNDKVALTSGPAYHAECAYSPDGSKIVYASNESGSMNIYIMQADGTDAKQLTHTAHCYNGGPFFSPDGSKIIFRADRDVPNLLQIYMMDVDGSHLTQLTDNAAVNWAPFWHPSQKAIAYTTSVHGHHNYEVYLLSLRTMETCRVTHHPAFDGLPTFNQDGTKMLWTSKRGQDGTCQIFIADFKLPETW